MHNFISMKPTTPTKTAPAGAFEKKAATLWPCAKGSLTWVKNKCKRPGCAKCASGEGHRALLYTFNKEGRHCAMSVRPELESALRKAIENGRALETLMVECGIEMVRGARRKP